MVAQVQRDLLPLIEGSQVQTKHGNINTDHILFVASGAFHYCKPSDLLAELQGRMPIRVELKPLTEQDLYTILTEPENNLVKQQVCSAPATRPREPGPACSARPALELALPFSERVLAWSRAQIAMMETEGVQLEITDEAKWRMAQLATEINRDVENIGCRRLHTIIERLMEDLSFSATDRAGDRIVLTEDDVQKSVGDLLKKTDLSRFIL